MEDKSISDVIPSTLDSNIELIKKEKNVITTILNSTDNNQNNDLDKNEPEENKLEENEIENNNSEEIVEENEENNEEKNIDNVDTTTDCLALTVRENYHIVVVKNLFRKSARMSWKVALSIITINFLNMFL